MAVRVSRGRRAARTSMIALLVACVLAGLVPAAYELVRHGVAAWTSTDPFNDRPGGRPRDDD